MAGPSLTDGRPWPLGASCDGDGVNFAVFSAHAQAIELCLLDASGTQELGRAPLPARSGDIWHGRLATAGAGLVYALRADGPWQPDRGHRFDASRRLLDPYARELVGAKACVVVDDVHHGPPPEPRPQTPLADTILYEAHVKGLTRLHPGVPAALRGSYAGLGSPAAIDHLQRLGVTAISLLPVQQHLDEPRLGALGLSNYWGYNTVAYFAVESRYASSTSPRREFRAMVAALHAAGIEVILDVVYNHTAESDLDGPTLAWRGLDNRSYYRTLPGAPGLYDNLTGCGNALDLRHPRVLQLVMDSLRYWAQAMNVDGFRFDLAPVLGRGDAGFDAHAAFFHAVAQDPALAGLKLIAEPWDLGPGGYQLGNFPPGWAEWNDRFRDGMRSFWLGGATAGRGEFARRLCASSDLFRDRRREPAESVNFIAAHDGFTLRDLLTYERKRNHANGEDNRDGHDANHGWNCGVEGPTGDAQVLALRAKLQRALLATLLLAQGTPMLAAGDELGHDQHGNNNAYCQDNATTWIDWEAADEALIAFTARVVALRKRLRPLGRQWYDGAPGANGALDIAWLGADGEALGADDWGAASPRTLAALVGGTLLLAVNADAETVGFALPAGRWALLLDTADDAAPAWRGQAPYALTGRSLALLTREGAAT